MKTATSPNTIRTICLTSVHATACTPPNIVYTAVGSPIARHVRGRFHPSTIDITTAGAEITTPHDMPRESRNNRLVNERVLASKRRSRYSYAV